MTIALPANRIAAIATWLSGLSALILAIEGTFPHAWQNTALGVGGLLVKLATTLKFLQGSQQWDKLTAGQTTVLPANVDELVPDLPPALPEAGTPAGDVTHGLAPDADPVSATGDAPPAASPPTNPVA